MKRPFLLSEVLVALFLISLLFPLLLHTMTHVQRAKRVQIEKMQLKTIAREAFCDLKENIARSTTSFENDIQNEASMPLKGPYILASSHTQWQGSSQLKVKKKYRKGEEGYFLIVDAKIILTCGKRKEEFIYPLTLDVGGVK